MEWSIVQILATKEALALLANDSIMLGRSIRLFRHLELQNLSIISDSIDWVRWCNNSGGAVAGAGGGVQIS